VTTVHPSPRVGSPGEAPDPSPLPGAAVARPDTGGGPGRSPRPPSKLHPGRVIALALAVALAPVAWSYGHALTRPSSDSLGIRTTEWVKDHGGRGLVAWAEKSWYTHHAPKKGGVPAAENLPVATTVSGPTSTMSGPGLKPATHFDTPTPPRLLVATPLPGEGVWQAGPRSAGGGPLVYTTFMRPNDTYTSLVTGLAWMDPRRVRMQLYSGSEQPGGSWQQMAPIPTDLRSSLVAAFNSGFKLSDSHGGYVAEGRQAPGRPLVDGKASLVIYKDGAATVGLWGRDAAMGPDIEAVRQNLVLLVDGGQEAPDLDHDSLNRWGFTPGNKTFVWRSGIGVDAQGHLIYAAGNLTVHALADVLKAAGCVRAMELDINSTWVHFLTYHDELAAPGGTAGTKLLPQMSASPELYFRSSSRDFLAVFARRDG